MSAISTLKMRITYPETFKHVVRESLQNPGKKTAFPSLRLVWENKKFSALNDVSRRVGEISQSNYFLGVSDSVIENQFRPLLEWAPFAGVLSGSLLFFLSLASLLLSDFSLAGRFFLAQAASVASLLMVAGGFAFCPKGEEESRALKMFRAQSFVVRR